ncbi:MAG: hypothetical protein ACT4QA_02740 [Panacagrimonas sp.]
MVSARRKDRQAAAQEPLEVQVTLAFRFGDEPADRVVMIDHRSIPMVGTVFDSRDAIARNFTKLLLKAGLTQPKVLRELVPVLKILQRRARKS